jgi:Fe-S-cluster-containing hydrogenase component 2
MKVYISQHHCIACGLCREVCPVGAVHPKFQDIHHWFEVVADACTGEGTCLEYCPAPGALVQYAESSTAGR